MARNEHLPIYKASYDLCLWLEQVVRGFGRYHKYAIGSDLRTLSRRILRLVVRANTRRDKTGVLLDVREEVEAMKAMLRLAFDAKAIEGIATFEHGMRMVVEIARQNEGWLKSQPSFVGAAAPASADPDGGAHAGSATNQESGRPGATRSPVQGRGQNRGSASSETAGPAAGAP